MSWKKFLLSGPFIKNAFLAFLIVVAFLLGIVMLLDFITNHGEEIQVPNIKKLTLEQAEEKLNEQDLDIVLLDTVDFRPEFPPYSVVEQDPIPNSLVKDGRKVYVKINSGGFIEVSIPEFEGKTLRQITSILRSLGLKEGKIEYKPDMARDVVLSLSMNGRELKRGQKVKQNSKIDFLVGDGKIAFEDPNDTLPDPNYEHLQDSIPNE